METRKMKTTSKVIALLTAFIMVLSVFAAVPPVEAFAKGTEKETFYYFENSSTSNKYTITIYGTTITSVKSSKPSVVKASKDSTAKYRAVLQLKKPGSSTVTVTYKNYSGRKASKKYSITVKDGTSICSFGTPTPITGECTNYTQYIYVPVKNTSKCGFSSLKIFYDLKDAAGNSVDADTKWVYYLGAGQTGYVVVNYQTSHGVDLSKSSFSVYDAEQASVGKNGSKPNKKLYSITSKLTDSGIAVTGKNKSDKSYSFNVYFFMYDANGTLCDVKSHNMYLSAKKTATDTLTRHSYDKYTSYKMKITGTSR